MFLSSEKAEMFLEVFGNSELRSETGDAVREAAARLCDYVTDGQETEPHPCLDTTLLKVGAPPLEVTRCHTPCVWAEHFYWMNRI